MDYNKGFEKLKDLFKNTTYEQEILILEQRYFENEHEANMFGDNDTTRSNRNRLIYRLNQLARLNHRAGEEIKSFNDMCLDR